MCMTQAPRGVDPAQWAADMWALTTGQLHGGAIPTDYVGPVGDRAGTLACTIMTFDPGRTVLDHLPRLLGASPFDDFRRIVFTRIGDFDLAQAWMREVMPMVTSKDPGNAKIWTVSKTQPLIGTPAAADFFCGRGDEVALEDALDQGRPVLIHVPADALGHVASRAAWSMIQHRFMTWAMRRTAPVDYVAAFDEWHLNALGTGNGCWLRFASSV